MLPPTSPPDIICQLNQRMVHFGHRVKTRARCKVMQLKFRSAFYIKLGKKGRWEEDSIMRNRLRIGWSRIPLKLITQERWPEIRRHGGISGTSDFNALRRICESSPEDIWITFYQNRLWWGRLARSQVRQDKTSKYRKLKGKWNNQNLKGDPLTLDQIPGSIAKIQGYRATCCQVKEVETLRCLLLGEPSEASRKLEQARTETEKAIASSIQALHWKDFETLVDLLLSRTGWRRLSRLGETMKDIDLELKDTLTRDIYHVQVKSEASLKDFKKFCDRRPIGVRRSYFVVHTPSKELSRCRQPKGVERILPEDLAPLIVQFGLINWIWDRTKYSGQL
jgi:hypothetical protein